MPREEEGRKELEGPVDGRRWKTHGESRRFGIYRTDFFFFFSDIFSAVVGGTNKHDGTSSQVLCVERKKKKKNFLLASIKGIYS